MRAKLHPSTARGTLVAILLLTAGSVAISSGAAERIGEIQLDVARRPPKLLAPEDLGKYFAGALQATFRSEGGRPIEVAFRGWLLGPDGTVVNECTSSRFEIAPGKPVGSDRLRESFQGCWPKRSEGKPAGFQVADMGTVAVDGKPVNLGLWNPNLGLWARKKGGDADHFVVITLVATESQIAEGVRTSPRIFMLKYPIEHG